MYKPIEWQYFTRLTTNKSYYEWRAECGIVTTNKAKVSVPTQQSLKKIITGLRKIYWGSGNVYNQDSRSECLANRKSATGKK